MKIIHMGLGIRERGTGYTLNRVSEAGVRSTRHLGC